MAKKKNIDWELIEAEFRAGQLSILEISRIHGCSDTAIRKRAAKLGWSRDLTKRIAEKVREKLVLAEVRDPDAKPIDENKIVELGAERGFQVVVSHRKDIASLRELETKLICELYDNPTKLYLAQYQGEVIQKRVALTAAEKAQAANNLANVQHKRIQLERQAFNIDGNSGDENSPKSILIPYNEPTKQES